MIERFTAKGSSKSLHEIKAELCAIHDVREREIAETWFFMGQLVPHVQPKQHIVAMIHGINTHAEWQQELTNQLEAECGIKAIPIGYRKFRVFKFIFPLYFRSVPVKLVSRKLRSLRNEYPDADISVIAHSFGTYILTKFLEEETDFKFYRIQLCGAVLDTDYRWDKIKTRIYGQIVNDAGSRDVFPILASKASWGYGESGTFGFKHPSVTDRHFDYAHSDFMKAEHVSNYWKPLLAYGQIVPSTFKREPPKFAYRVLRNIPFNYILWIVIPLLVVFFLIPFLSSIIKF